MYIGSFNADAPINTAKNPECEGLFRREHEALLEDLYDVRGGFTFSLVTFSLNRLGFQSAL